MNINHCEDLNSEYKVPMPERCLSSLEDIAFNGFVVHTLANPFVVFLTKPLRQISRERAPPGELMTHFLNLRREES